MNTSNFSNGPRWNGVICPKCGEDCFNTWGLIEHMKTYHSNRSPDWSSMFAAAFLALVVTVSLMHPVYATGRRDGSQAPVQPTPSISTPPSVVNLVFLPFVAINLDEVDGQAPSGGPAHKAYVWCPGCKE